MSNNKNALELMVDRIAALEQVMLGVAEAVRVALPYTQPQIDRTLADWNAKLQQLMKDAES